MVKNSPGSESVGYALKIPRIPMRRNVAYSGSYLVHKIKDLFARQFTPKARPLTEILCISVRYR